jgi:hypothetical protein
MRKSTLNTTGQERRADNASSAKSFVAASCLMFLTILGLVAVTNYVVNPYAWYAPEVVQPQAQLSHKIKVAQLQQALEPPPGLVLGSSRVMQVEPAYLQAKTGYAFYNAGVNAATAEDYLAMLRFYLNTFHQPPRTIVLGIDVEAFDSRPASSRLQQVPELWLTILDLISLRDRLLLLSKLLDWYQITSSIRSLIIHFSQRAPEPLSAFLPDGTIRYLDMEKQKANGTFDSSHEIAVGKVRKEQRFAAFHHLSRKRQDVLKAFLDLCREQHIELIVFLTPLHPEVLQHVSEKTEFLARHEEVKSLLYSLASIYLFPIFDFTDIKNFKGISEDFKDAEHYLILNSRRIIDEISRHISLKGL